MLGHKIRVLPLAVLMSLICMSSAWAAATGKVLYSFKGPPDGAYPNAEGPLTLDSAGNLYGTTFSGGSGGGTGCNIGCGTVFELSPTQSGGTEKVLYNFSNDANGFLPTAGVVFDKTGNLYGTTQGGVQQGGEGCGTVFQLVPNSGGWTLNTLHTFDGQNGGTDGCYPVGLTFDSVTGNIYGVTPNGGTYGGGTVFELTPSAGGGWTYGIIYTFGAYGTGDGRTPFGNLVVDTAGNLYGTTVYGGVYNSGTVFVLTNSNNVWTEKVIYFAYGNHGDHPYGGVIFDKEGSLYGTTRDGGTNGVGVVYKLTPTAGNWQIQVIRTFTGGIDGGEPITGSLAMDDAGNLYGETYYGGLYEDGVVYKLSQSGKKWTEQVLHSFANGPDGSNPEGGLIFDSHGNLYGTSSTGGAGGYGVVFEGEGIGSR